jgi:hypothetical protein
MPSRLSWVDGGDQLAAPHHEEMRGALADHALGGQQDRVVEPVPLRSARASAEFKYAAAGLALAGIALSATRCQDETQVLSDSLPK